VIVNGQLRLALTAGFPQAMTADELDGPVLAVYSSHDPYYPPDRYCEAITQFAAAATR
jgi:hypothetical protein